MKATLIRLALALPLAAASLGALAGTAADDIKVNEPWAREVPPMTSTSAGFMGLQNSGSVAHKIVSASSPASGMVELHTHTNDNGVMRMRQVESIEIPAGGATTLQPGGLHLMLMMLKQPLVAGQDIDIQVKFEDGSTKDIKAQVRKFDMMQGNMKH